jgi:tryptophanyl-tRNA synthetase
VPVLRADWHALTTHYDNPQGIEQATWDMVIDWLAAGVDPNQATLFIQSGCRSTPSCIC